MSFKNPRRRHFNRACLIEFPVSMHKGMHQHEDSEQWSHPARCWANQSDQAPDLQAGGIPRVRDRLVSSGIPHVDDNCKGCSCAPAECGLSSTLGNRCLLRRGRGIHAGNFDELASEFVKLETPMIGATHFERQGSKRPDSGTMTPNAGWTDKPRPPLEAAKESRTDSAALRAGQAPRPVS